MPLFTSGAPVLAAPRPPAVISIFPSTTTFGGGYQVVDSEKVTVKLVGGVRYHWLETKLKLDLSTVVLGHKIDRKEKETLSGDVWDGIVGVKGKINLNDKSVQIPRAQSRIRSLSKPRSG